MDETCFVFEFVKSIVPMVTAIVAVWRYYRNSCSEHAVKMMDLMREFQDEHAGIFYNLVERKDREFYAGNLAFSSDEDERNADALLLFMENILHLRAKGTISKDEFIHFEYYLKRIVEDRDFGKYLCDFGCACINEQMVNPFVRILEYCKKVGLFDCNKVLAVGKDCPREGRSGAVVFSADQIATSENLFVKYLEYYYHGMTRTAKSVKSRVDHYLPKKGWSYAKPPTKSELLEAIRNADKDTYNADVAASVRSALRQYYRASFDEEPNA